MNTGLATRYFKELGNNIGEKLQVEVVNVLEAFNTPNTQMTLNRTSKEFEIYAVEKTDVFKQRYYSNECEKDVLLSNQGEDFKHELISFKKKLINSKDKLKFNKLELKFSALLWSLKQIVRYFFRLKEYRETALLAQVALTIPLTKVRPKQGASEEGEEG